MKLTALTTLKLGVGKDVTDVSEGAEFEVDTKLGKQLEKDGLAAEGTTASKRKSAPTREDLDKALAALPDGNKDPEYVVTGMRRHFGDLFTADDEAKVRDLVKPDAK